jgi:tryptophan halogenase
MKKPIKRIIIAGGGSSGWMSAAMLSTQFPDMEVALIESPDIPIIGVGESTLGTINQYLGLLGLKDKDWMSYCNATYKLAIKFTDFYEKGESFYYPFGVKDLQNTQQGATDWYVKKILNPDLDKNDFYDSVYSSMPMIYQNKIFDNKDGQLPGFSWRNDSAYHMDATLFGEFLKEKVCIPNGVVHISANIEGVLLEDDGYINGLKLDNGDVVEADLYIDCTGFKSLLLEQTMGVPFYSYSSHLPNNHAWVTHIPYADKNRELENVTNCTAIGNGWVWNIPLYNRIGSGYVFCDKFISKEDALQEYKDYLNSDKMKMPQPIRSEFLEFRLIEIKNGVHERAWHKNCVGIGLSYAFVEPLESTGLLSVQEMLLKLCETLRNKQINKIHVDHFNYICNYTMDGFRNFVAYHYVFSSRRDTPYWKYVTEEIEMDSLMLDRNFNQIPTAGSDLAVKLLQMHNLPGDASMGGMPDILVGMDVLPVSKTQLAIVKQLIEARHGQAPEFFTSQTQDYWDQKKEYINSLMETAPSHFEYLRDNIYTGTEK